MNISSQAHWVENILFVICDRGVVPLVMLAIQPLLPLSDPTSVPKTSTLPLTRSGQADPSKDTEKDKDTWSNRDGGR